MRRLGNENLAEEHPSKIVQWLFYSHPADARMHCGSAGVRESLDRISRARGTVAQDRLINHQATKHTKHTKDTKKSSGWTRLRVLGVLCGESALRKRNRDLVLVGHRYRVGTRCFSSSNQLRTRSITFAEAGS